LVGNSAYPEFSGKGALNLDALSMMKATSVLFGIAAVGALTMAIIRFGGADRTFVARHAAWPCWPARH
jgi:hypothetical protein